MSGGTREVLGEPKHISDLVLRTLPERSRSGARFRVYSWHFWRVWESRDTVLLGVRPPQLPDATLAEFQRLEGRLVRSYFRLAEEERLLSDRARRRRGRSGGGRQAIRQIELERQRLGRELHTGVGQTLAGIRLQLEIIATEMPLPPHRVMESLESIAALSASALEQVRSVSRKLHPPEWQRLTLEDAIRQLWDISGIPGRFAGELKIEPLPRDPLPEIKALLYRTVQEALSNVVRHSKASRIDAELRTDGEQAVLTISDNGVGFDVAAMRAAPASVAAGIGLRSIRDLVAESGGKFHVESGPLGTKLVVSVAITPSE